MNHFTVVRNFSTSLSVSERTSRQKIGKDIKDTKLLALIDISSTCHWILGEYTVFSTVNKYSRDI